MPAKAGIQSRRGVSIHNCCLWDGSSASRTMTVPAIYRRACLEMVGTLRFAHPTDLRIQRSMPSCRDQVTQRPG